MALRSIEAKAFVPAKDFDRSRRFYRDLGFSEVWCAGDLAYFRHDRSSFLLQDFYVREHAENFVMSLLVDDVDAWWQHVVSCGLLEKYKVRCEPPTARPWGMRDFVLFDPSGVLWRIGQPLA